MQQSLDSRIKAPHHSNPSTPKSLRNTAHSNPRPSDQKPQAPMEAMDASGSRLCQIIQGAGLRPRTAQRFQTVLAIAGIVQTVIAAEGGNPQLPEGPDPLPVSFSLTQRRLGRSFDPSSSMSYCPQIRSADADIPETLGYKFFESGLALLPQLPTCLHVHLFLLPSALPKPPKFLVLLEVKLLHAFESRALFKQRRKGGKL